MGVFSRRQAAEASAASILSLRTGTCDRTLLYHAASIGTRSGDVAEARRLVARSLDGNPRFDLVSAPAARALRDALAAEARLQPGERERHRMACAGLTQDERIEGIR